MTLNKFKNKMKIVAIDSSLRKKEGFTHRMLQKIGEGVVKSGGDFEVIRLVEREIKDCIACDYCQQNRDMGCVFKEQDDVENIFLKIKESDLVIYATPVYGFQMSSLLKRFLERFYSLSNHKNFNITQSGYIFPDVNRSICEKKFMVLISCDSIEKKSAENVISYFKNFAKFFDAECVGIIKRNFAWYFFEHKKSKNYNELFNGLRCMGEELVKREKVSKKAIKIVEKQVIPVPYFILTLLKKNKKGRRKILENIKKFKMNNKVN